MNARALLVLSSMLGSQAWSQELVTTPARAPQTFDLRSDSVKQILRNTAATQYATVQLSEEKTVKPDRIANLDDVTSAVLAPPLKYRAPRPAPARPQGILSALVDILVETALDPDTYSSPRGETWISCGNGAVANQRNEQCPAVPTPLPR